MYTYYFNLQIFFALFFEKIENNFSFNSILLVYKDLKLEKFLHFCYKTAIFRVTDFVTPIDYNHQEQAI